MKITEEFIQKYWPCACNEGMTPFVGLELSEDTDLSHLPDSYLCDVFRFAERIGIYLDMDKCPGCNVDNRKQNTKFIISKVLKKLKENGDI